MNEIYMMCIITERELRNKYKQFFIDNNIPVTFSTLGKGTASNATLDYFGLEANDKVIYLSIVTYETWEQLKKQLYYKMRIDVPGLGIAFLIPLSSVGGKKTLQYLTAEQTVVIEEESTLKETKYELLVTIANAGYTETIMKAIMDQVGIGAPAGAIIFSLPVTSIAGLRMLEDA